MSSSSDVEMSSPKSKHLPLQPLEVSDPMMPRICRTDLNKVIMNYLFNEGYKEASRLFCLETGLETPLPLDAVDSRTKVRDAIEDGRMLETITLLHSLYPDLLTNFHDLYFEIQKQHLVELIRSREIEGALNFAQSQLADQGKRSPEALSELERVMSLLAFDDPYSSPYGDLLLESQRLKLASKVNAAILASSNQDSRLSLLEFYKLLLWAQHELDQKKVFFSRMTDLGTATFDSTGLTISDSEKL